MVALASVPYWGTPWADDDLLAQSIAEAKAAQKRDGIRRHFEVSVDQVTAANPLYGRHVQAEIERLGQSHPIIRTQYLMQTLAQAGKLLTAAQLDALCGEHQPEASPCPGGAYVAAIDVAGADEEDPDGVLTRVNPKRDSTVLGIARVEEPSVARSNAGEVVEPILRLVRIYAWTGTPHRQLYPTLLELVQAHWGCRTVMVDATGLGSRARPRSSAPPSALAVLRPYVYNAAIKSQLAYGLLEALNARRLTVYAESTDP